MNANMVPKSQGDQSRHDSGSQTTSDSRRAIDCCLSVDQDCCDTVFHDDASTQSESSCATVLHAYQLENDLDD